MNLETNYYYFNNAISSEMCDKIIKEYSKKTLEEGKTGFSSEKANPKIRKSKVYFTEDQWLYDLLWPYVHTANREAKWNFDIDWAEPIQFTKYGLKEHYDWHVDSYNKPFSEENGSNFVNKIRKLSCVVLLSDPKDFKGGDFLFHFKNQNPDIEAKNYKKYIHKAPELNHKGSLIVFPSFLYHKVESVVKGNRYSLVMWTVGMPWK